MPIRVVMHPSLIIQDTTQKKKEAIIPVAQVAIISENRAAPKSAMRLSMLMIQQQQQQMIPLTEIRMTTSNFTMWHPFLRIRIYSKTIPVKAMGTF